MKPVSVISAGLGLLLSVGILTDAWMKGFDSFDWLPIFIGGIFFLIIAFINERNNFRSGGPYFSITMALFLFFHSYMSITIGYISFRWGRYTYTYIDIETQPEKFWAMITLELLIGTALALYSYWSFKKLNKQSSTS